MVIGHQKQRDFLERAAALGKLPHGLLFFGEEQLGKKTLAIELAKFLNCQCAQSEKRPCQVCRNCREIQRMAHPDFILIEPGSSRGEIQISQIRDLIWKLSLHPYSSAFKIAVIDKAHLLNREAQNCLLKLLEEPKGNAILILVTEFPQILLPTILSRVQKIRFFPVKNGEIESYLKSRGVAQEQASYLAPFSLGRPGLAQSFIDDPSKIEKQKKIADDFVKIINSDLASRFKYAKELAETEEGSPNSLSEILNVWLDFFRKTILARFNPAQSSQNNQQISECSLQKLIKNIKLIQSTNFLLSTTNVNHKLALEVLLMQI